MFFKHTPRDIPATPVAELIGLKTPRCGKDPLEGTDIETLDPTGSSSPWKAAILTIGCTVFNRRRMLEIRTIY